MIWIYILGGAAIVVLWGIALQIGSLQSTVGEQLAQIQVALQTNLRDGRDLRAAIDRLDRHDLAPSLDRIAEVLTQISTRVYDLHQTGRNTLAIRDAARSIRQSAAENHGAQLEEARIMYADITKKLDAIVRGLSTPARVQAR